MDSNLLEGFLGAFLGGLGVYLLSLIVLYLLACLEERNARIDALADRIEY